MFGVKDFDDFEVCFQITLLNLCPSAFSLDMFFQREMLMGECWACLEKHTAIGLLLVTMYYIYFSQYLYVKSLGSDGFVLK